MTALCPYRAACMERWHVTRLDFRCSFEKHNLLENCPRHERQQRQTEATREGRMDTSGLEQPGRDYQPPRAGVAVVQLSLGA
jgi:hypothetical protein